MKSEKTSNTATNGTMKKAGTKMVTPKSNAAKGLRDLLEDMLKDIYWAEKALVKALPKMIKNSTSPELADAIKEHLEVTKGQVTRVEQVFESLGKKPQAKKCEAMEGLIKEGVEILESTEKGVVRDAGIIAASQKVEHYEIASYGTMAAFARTLGETEAAALLEETLSEEKTADESLSDCAMGINVEAVDAEEEDESENGVPNTKTKKATPKRKKQEA